MKTTPILVTGSEGLIGTAVCSLLQKRGFTVRRFDVSRTKGEDTTNPYSLRTALLGTQGVVHLAAVSRVIWAQTAPEQCEKTNVTALKTLLQICAQQHRQWVIFASSREVYGTQSVFPVPETALHLPMNIYARSKCAGEQLVCRAQESGLNANICRFSSVYGSVDDHADRVVPAFARAAQQGSTIRIDGPTNTFDFVHVDDAARGLADLVELTIQSKQPLPAMHFVTGVGTTLEQLADLAARFAVRAPQLVEAPPRNFDVSKFVGDPRRAAEILGWHARTSIQDGMADLVSAFNARARRSRIAMA